MSKSIRTGLIGAGIQASRSPAMHTTECRALGFDPSYTLFDFDLMPDGAAALPRVLEQAQKDGFLGVNITYPVKQTVIGLLDGHSDDVGALGACNTVVLKDGKRIGHNTDWFGFAENFRRGLPDAPLDCVLQLGAGGAGSAVTYALLKLGAQKIVIHEIDADRAAVFVRRFNDWLGTERVFLSRSLEDDAAAAVGVVNCTPVGMAKVPGLPFPAHLLRPALWVADVVYVPLRTELLRLAEQRGCRTLGGGGMAVFQAGEAIRLFTGLEPDYARMLAAFQRDIEAGLTLQT
jgi:shikimate dehydrogenase